MLKEDELQAILAEGLQLTMQGSMVQVLLVLLESVGHDGLDSMLECYQLSERQQGAVLWAKQAHSESKSSYELPVFKPPVIAKPERASNKLDFKRKRRQ